MNVKKPNRRLREAEKDNALFSVIHDLEDTVTCMYPDSEGKKRRVFFHQLALYPDGTLKIVENELKERLHLDTMTFSTMDPQERLLAERFVNPIEERLEVRCLVKLAEIQLGVRKEGKCTC